MPRFAPNRALVARPSASPRHPRTSQVLSRGLGEKSGLAFARVVIVDDAGEQSGGDPRTVRESTVELRHRSGWSIRVGAGFDEGVLGRILSVVSSRC